jgi:hypothetical protein
MKLTKKSETATKITFTYDKPAGTEGYRYYADAVPVSRTFNPDDLEVTFGKIPSGRYSVEALGFTSLARAEWPETTPPPTGDKLTWRPPTLSNPKTVVLTNQVGQVVDGGGGDVIVTPGWHRSVPWGANVYQGVKFQNIRNMIMLAGWQTVNFSTTTDDGSNRHGLHWENIKGHVFVEGCLFDGGALRALIVGEQIQGSTFTFQNCRIEGIRDNRHWLGGDLQHSDSLYHWGEGNTLQIDKCTFEYDNTGLAYYDGGSNPIQGPDRSDLRRLFMKCINEHANGGFVWIASEHCRSTAVDCYVTTAKWWGPGIQKPLQDQMGMLNDFDSPPNSPPPYPWKFTPYKVTRPSNGAVLDIKTYQQHSSVGTLNGMGKQNGDYIERQTPQFAGERWIYGPPAVDPCPRELVGPAYKSPGYV